MEIRTMRIEDLSPADYNPRVDLQPGDPDYEALRRSVEEFGLVEPLVFNERTGRLVGGHQRLKVLRATGWTEVEVSVVDLDEVSEKTLNIALNKIEGDWDEAKLSSLLVDIKEFGEVELTGFTDVEFSKMLDAQPKANNKDGNEVPEDGPSVTVPGDVWVMGSHRLLCGDCLLPASVDAVLGNEKVDQVLTDPPYGVDYSGKNEMLNALDKGNRNQRPIQNDAIEDYRAFFAGFLGIIPFSSHNTVYCFMSGQELHNLRMGAEDAGLNWADWLVWVKNNHVLGRKDYNAKHEFIYYGWNGRHKFYGPHRNTVLEFPKPQSSKLHPTMKPVELLSQLLVDGSQREAVVYDPFCGSGSTLIACEINGRWCRGIELEAHYCDVIVRRWQEFTSGEAVLEATGQTFEEVAGERA